MKSVIWVGLLLLLSVLSAILFVEVDSDVQMYSSCVILF